MLLHNCRYIFAFLAFAAFYCSSNVLADAQSQNIASFCSNLAQKYKELKWRRLPCDASPNGKPVLPVAWKHSHLSVNGVPLVYAVFGTGAKTTLILGGVHPDEFTPIHLAFSLAETLAKANHQSEIDLSKSRIVLAPLVNPDGFFRKNPTRTNARKVDLNRNFPTQDWNQFTNKQKKMGQSKLRYFPGNAPHSEPETQFQTWLVEEFKVSQVISIHAPLGFLDYDGPAVLWNDNVKKPTPNLAEIISKAANNFKLKDYLFFPGSLGTFLGKERKIPTVTLELPTKNPAQAETIFAKFQSGILKASALHSVIESKVQ